MLFCLQSDLLGIDGDTHRKYLFRPTSANSCEATCGRGYNSGFRPCSQTYRVQDILLPRLHCHPHRQLASQAGLQQLESQAQELPLVAAEQQQQQNGAEPLNSFTASQKLIGMLLQPGHPHLWLEGQALSSTTSCRPLQGPAVPEGMAPAGPGHGSACLPHSAGPAQCPCGCSPGAAPKLSSLSSTGRSDTARFLPAAASLTVKLYRRCASDLCLCHLQAGHAQRALQVFTMMQQADMRPNLATWCQVISALAGSRRRGQLLAQEAFSLWVELQDSGLALDSKSYVVGTRLTGPGKSALQRLSVLPDSAWRQVQPRRSKLGPGLPATQGCSSRALNRAMRCRHACVCCSGSPRRG